jgi:hypothetical protein
VRNGGEVKRNLEKEIDRGKEINLKKERELKGKKSNQVAISPHNQKI